jgi:hypothetical protein
LVLIISYVVSCNSWPKFWEHASGLMGDIPVKSLVLYLSPIIFFLSPTWNATLHLYKTTQIHAGAEPSIVFVFLFSYVYHRCSFFNSSTSFGISNLVLNQSNRSELSLYAKELFFFFTESLFFYSEGFPFENKSHLGDCIYQFQIVLVLWDYIGSNKSRFWFFIFIWFCWFFQIPFRLFRTCLEKQFLTDWWFFLSLQMTVWGFLSLYLFSFMLDMMFGMYDLGGRNMSDCKWLYIHIFT